jgi:uncharacterized protein
VATSILVLPGIGGSGPEHWQTRWEANEPSFRRAQMPDWDRPSLEPWLLALEHEVKVSDEPPVMVAHSLGCLAVAHFAARGGKLRAALLVAVPDPNGPAFPAVASSFGPVPLTRMPFPSRVVMSRNDPYASPAFSRHVAEQWGSALTDLGEVGHINAASGLGDWPEGRNLLAALLG